MFFTTKYKTIYGEEGLKISDRIADGEPRVIFT